MNTDGSLLVLVFALCGVGALAGLAVPERRIAAFLAWAGSLAALAMLWVSMDVLRLGGVFKSELWATQPLGTLSVFPLYAFSSKVCVGHPVSQIVRYAESLQIDHIVFGHRSPLVIERWLASSTAARVCPGSLPLTHRRPAAQLS